MYKSYFNEIIKNLIRLETENRTLQEIEEHFRGIKKLQKSPQPITASFPENFDVKTWENNDKFERYLKDHKSTCKNGKIQSESSDTHL